MNSYKDLIVWQKAIQLVVLVYENTKQFPKEEMFGLAFQLRKSAVSIPSNIAEGYGRLSLKEKQRFLSIARGSCTELETQLFIAKELGFFNQEVFQKVDVQREEVSKMLYSLVNKRKS